MSIRNFLEEENKESRVYKYASKNFNGFINFENEIIEKLKNKKILSIKSQIEVEYMEKELFTDDFSQHWTLHKIKALCAKKRIERRYI